MASRTTGVSHLFWLTASVRDPGLAARVNADPETDAAQRPACSQRPIRIHSSKTPAQTASRPTATGRGIRY